MSLEQNRRRWLALAVIVAAQFMVVLDVAIVNVALPSIRTDLGFTETSLAWVVNAYLLTFGGSSSAGHSSSGAGSPTCSGGGGSSSWDSCSSRSARCSTGSRGRKAR